MALFDFFRRRSGSAPASPGRSGGGGIGGFFRRLFRPESPPPAPPPKPQPAPKPVQPSAEDRRRKEQERQERERKEQERREKEERERMMREAEAQARRNAKAQEEYNRQKAAAEKAAKEREEREKRSSQKKSSQKRKWERKNYQPVKEDDRSPWEKSDDEILKTSGNTERIRGLILGGKNKDGTRKMGGYIEEFKDRHQAAEFLRVLESDMWNEEYATYYDIVAFQQIQDAISRGLTAESLQINYNIAIQKKSHSPRAVWEDFVANYDPKRPNYYDLEKEEESQEEEEPAGATEEAAPQPSQPKSPKQTRKQKKRAKRAGG